MVDLPMDQPGSPPAQDHDPGHTLPSTIFGYILRFSGRHQIALAALSVVVFLLNTIPLEIQRRIVNDAVHAGALTSIVWLALGYAGVALAEGACKLAMNIYRGWVSESSVQHLRMTIQGATNGTSDSHSAELQGVEVSLILSEVEPIGNFVGISTSEPLLQGGILLSVFAYMIHLKPEIALVSLLVFSPQLIFVPLMQRAINRRVASRVQVLREISSGLIDPGHERRHAMSQAQRMEVVFTLNMGIYKLKFTMNFLMNLMHHIGVAVVLGVGGWYATTGQIQVGTVVAFIAGLAKVNDPWGDIVNWYREATVNGVKYRMVVAAFERLVQTRPALKAT